ncbi:MAG: cysteine--tRNA ligase [Bacteroidota bacterium]
MSQLYIYNTLSRTKEVFAPINPPFVGMYVCGPTVYNDVHLGNCRTFVSFDLIYRYLLFSGYKVRYVRNITDAGHLEGDRDEGDDKFTKRARLEQLEPMEIVQKYTLGFHDVMKALNTLPPSIEPTATGHICEQLEMIKTILEAGYAYIVNGSVYFDVERFSSVFDYGALTNRKREELFENTRELHGQDEKRGRLDFALWIKAKPETLMQWPSPWGWGFPGWHIECSAMSKKYLGETFDIHGGGMDLQATHHTNEIAQSKACCKDEPVKYWMHTNMLTVNGTRMSKSAGNGFLPQELFSGTHALLEKAYHPMTVRFFMLQTHYRSTLDFSNDALQASEKGLQRLWNAVNALSKIKPGKQHHNSIDQLDTMCKAAMNDDFNSPVLIATLFEHTALINAAAEGKAELSQDNLNTLKHVYNQYMVEVLGLTPQALKTEYSRALQSAMNLLLQIRTDAKTQRHFELSDHIRKNLEAGGIRIQDHKDGSTWDVM